MKRYRLLKDLPYTKAGAIYTPENYNQDYYNSNGGSYRNRINKEYVENNPDWFTEIKEEEPTIVTSLMHCKPSGNLFVFTDNKGEHYSVDGKLLRLLLSHLPEFPPKKSWSDNDIIEYAIWYFIDKETSGFGYTEKELLEVWKSKRRKA